MTYFLVRVKHLVTWKVHHIFGRLYCKIAAQRTAYFKIEPNCSLFLLQLSVWKVLSILGGWEIYRPSCGGLHCLGSGIQQRLLLQVQLTFNYKLKPIHILNVHIADCMEQNMPYCSIKISAIIKWDRFHT